jgi:TIR domain
MKPKARTGADFQYDVCLSFAGEDRAYVERVANALRTKGIRIFYDKYERVELWGKELYSHLDYVYRHAARYCVVFVSKSYSSKLWTNHERKSAQARAFTENSEYILPARFDDTQVPGLLDTVGYLDLQHLGPRKLAEFIIEKLGPRQRKNFLPPVLDRLYKRVGATTPEDRERVSNIAHCFFEAFQRMSHDERKVISELFINGCAADLPQNIHINLDLLRRVTTFPVAKIKKLITGLRSLGFYSRLRSERDHGDLIEVVFNSLSSSVEPKNDETGVAVEMVHGMGEDLCGECCLKALMEVNFSQLASVTTEKELHRARKRTTPRGHVSLPQ